MLGNSQSMYDEIDANLWLSNPITQESIPYISDKNLAIKV